MINELEKQFFQCFGIEARQKCAKPLLKNTGGFCKAYKNCVGCDYNDLIYPQITDRILLELICIINQMDLYFYDELYYFTAFNYKDLKEEVISKCKRLADKNALSEVTGEHIKHQVCALFEEG